jgi:hypothetical protein
MKTYFAITLSVLVLILTGISLVGAEELYGTWKNEDYNTTDSGWRAFGRFAKLVFNQAGTFVTYNSTTAKTMHSMGSFEITEKWTDTDGNICYKLSSTIKGSVSPEPYYWTVRISNSGKTLEYGMSSSDYPKEKDIKKAYWYGILDHE